MAGRFILFDPKVEGESTDSKHKGEIEVLTWSVGGTQSASASISATGGGGQGKVAIRTSPSAACTARPAPSSCRSCAPAST